jgi:tetratricopeptide (TPR) repeat protein
MKKLLFILCGFFPLLVIAQVKKQEEQRQKEANDLVYEGNELLANDDFISAEMEYRKALSTQADNVAGAYNLGNIYYNNESYNEALFRHQEAAKKAKSKEEKHRAFHNIGNILMKNDQCKEAVEAYKNALRNNPADDETRYNFALAKECAKDQDGGGESEKEDENEDEKKEQEDQKKEQEEDNKDNKDDEGEKDKKQGEEEEDENGKPKDEKNDEGEGDENKKPQQNKPQPGKLSPQQIKNILDAMNNQEQKVQEKMNAKKQKGAKVKKEKDW